MQKKIRLLTASLVIACVCCKTSKSDTTEEVSEVRRDTTKQATDSVNYRRGIEKSVEEKLLPVYKKQIEQEKKNKSNEK